MNDYTEKDLEELAGSLFVAGFEGTEPPEAVVDLLASGTLSGVILFRRNIEEPRTLARMTGRILGAAPDGLPPIVSIDQEGGRVQRFPSSWVSWPSAAELGATGDVDLIRKAGSLVGRQLAHLGINLDFAPVLDVDSNPKNPIIGSRAFSGDPERAGPLAMAFASGLLDSRVVPCGKHFPGHGDTYQDSHETLPLVAHDDERLRRVELAPFRHAAPQLPMIMTAHVVYPAWDGEEPATLSETIVKEMLRRECGFGGVVVSDDLEMKAVAQRYPIEELAVRCVRAGVDLMLVCHRLELIDRARQRLVQEARRDEELFRRICESAHRVYSLRERLSSEPPEEEGADGPFGDTAFHREVAELLEAIRAR
jgi:beta-N-acetylhexosaminidase